MSIHAVALYLSLILDLSYVILKFNWGDKYESNAH